MSDLKLENLHIYQRSIDFSFSIYSITQQWPKEHLFGITDQIRRASLSISLNIAEGYGRTRKDFQRFLLIARGSCFECLPILEIALKLELLSVIQKQKLYNEIIELTKMISSLHKKLP